MPILRSDKRVAALIQRVDRVKYQVGSVELTDGMDDGANTIAEFQARWESGEINLASVYPKIENSDLAQVPSITAMLRLKGVDPSAVD
jgi:hypothetical protein